MAGSVDGPDDATPKSPSAGADVTPRAGGVSSASLQTAGRTTTARDGPRIPGYRIELALGAAAIGKTYRARPDDDREGPPVVIKVVDDKVAQDQLLRAKVIRDIDRYAKIDHPHILRVVAHGEAEGRPYYAIELVPRSTTLLDLVRRARPLDAPELAYVARALASALCALHAVGLAHGDLTPVNIAVSAGGVLKIVDLGWAPRIRDTLGGGNAARSASQRFSHQLIAAAVAKGEGQDAGKIADEYLRKSDIAALGATLAYATTGQPAKQGGPGLVERAPWLPAALSQLVDEMRIDPDKRPTPEKILERLKAIATEVGLGEKAPATLDEALASIMEPHGAPAGSTEPGAPSRLAANAAPALGKFGRYVLLDEIARGGMGAVFRARHAELERIFALKVMLSSDVTSDQARARFLREAEAAVRLDHPGIVRVHDFGEVDGRAYMAMDLAPGVPLNELYKNEELDLVDDLVPIVHKVADAVHYAHSRAIIHRDLKPANVVVDEVGQPRILDFGVAKRIDAHYEAGKGAAGLTTAGELVGTPAYMSPEQAEGRTNDIDTRSDVYSLGVILFEVATRGRLPFEGTNVTDVLTKILLDDPPAPSKLVPGIPWEIDAIVLKAIEKDPKKRYQSAAAFEEDLRRFIEGVPISTRPAGLGYRVKKWVLRNRVPVAIGAIGFVVIAMLGVKHEIDAIAAARDRAERIDKLVAAGRRMLGQRQATEARDQFLRALELDASSLPASLGKQAAEHVLEQAQIQKEEEEQRQRARARAAVRVREAKKLLDGQDAEGARVAFRQALLDDRDNEEAQKGLEQATRLVLAAEEARRLGVERERAKKLTDDGRAALAAGKIEEARRAFDQAVAFDGSNEEAHKGLAEAQRLAFEEKARVEAADRKTRDKAEAARLVEEGRAAFSARRYDDARRSYLQALGFDGTNEAATEGLQDVARRLTAAAREDEQRRRRDEAAKFVRDGRTALEKGRQLARDNAEGRAVRAAYFDALQAFDKAITIAPDDATARFEKVAAARELARLAKASGNYGLYEYLALLAGDEAGTENESAAQDEGDAFLVVKEADAVVIQRAFREQVDFERCDAWFQWIRDGIMKPAGDRFRLIVEIRSRVEATSPPTVHATGITMRVQDKLMNVTTAPEQIDFEGGPFQRVVVAGTQGRVVKAFYTAHGIDGRAKESPIAQRCEATARALVAKLADKH